MSTIKIGDRVVQTTDRSGRIRGGIDSESRLDQNPQRTKTDTQIVQDQIKKIKDIEEQFKGVDDNRSKFLALSTPKATFEVPLVTTLKLSIPTATLLWPVKS